MSSYSAEANNFGSQNYYNTSECVVYDQNYYNSLPNYEVNANNGFVEDPQVNNIYIDQNQQYTLPPIKFYHDQYYTGPTVTSTQYEADSGYFSNDSQSACNSSSSTVSSPRSYREHSPSINYNVATPSNPKSPYSRTRGRPMMNDHGPQGVIKKRLYARGYRSAKKEKETKLAQAAYELYKFYKCGTSPSSETLHFMREREQKLEKDSLNDCISTYYSQRRY